MFVRLIAQPGRFRWTHSVDPTDFGPGKMLPTNWPYRQMASTVEPADYDPEFDPYGEDDLPTELIRFRRVKNLSVSSIGVSQHVLDQRKEPEMPKGRGHVHTGEEPMVSILFPVSDGPYLRWLTSGERRIEGSATLVSKQAPSFMVHDFSISEEEQ